ncbi:MAG: beta-ketoacyl synthase chain length factor, partial [Burkholderiaceae bacterium]
AIKVAMAVADEAVAQAGVDAQFLATVFSASNGEAANCHYLCETLASADRCVSPTRFTNSVHNAAAGYWHIAVASRAASTSLCGLDASFGAGLLEAVTQVGATNQAVLLVASDTPYPQPLHATRPLLDNFGLALLLAPPWTEAMRPTRPAIAWLRLALSAATQEGGPTPCRQASFETLRAALPAAAGLSLLEAFAQPGRAQRVILNCPAALQLHIEVRQEPA